MSALLEAVNIGKRFGGIEALSSISLTIQRGEIYGLIGPNGAGKTTFFNVLTGVYRADSGDFNFNDTVLNISAPHEVAASGIARTFQNIRLFANMSALENVMVGRHARTNAEVLGAVFRGRRTRAEEADTQERAQALLNRVGLASKGQVLACHLAYGDQRRLEIARALASEPRLLALDEPVAGMNPSERLQMGELMRELRADGLTLLLIEHDVKLVMGLCDRVAVLDYGRKIAEGPAEAVRNDPAVIAAYLGSEA